MLVLDSLDQLSSLHQAHALTWLPKQLPPNVKLIVSTLPEEHKILQTLKNWELCETQYVEVKELTPENSKAILNLWLNLQNRQITTDQQERVSKVGDASVLHHHKPLHATHIDLHVY